MASGNTVVLVSIAVIGSVALSAMTNMLLDDFGRDDVFTRTVVPTTVIAIFGVLVILYTAFYA